MPLPMAGEGLLHNRKAAPLPTMDAFSPVPPDWTQPATHAYNFFCPRCGASSRQAQAAWINRRSPVYGENRRRKWQEFYYCECGFAWWAWSSDRPPSEYGQNADAADPDTEEL
jgi:hypothetical protein